MRNRRVLRLVVLLGLVSAACNPGGGATTGSIESATHVASCPDACRVPYGTGDCATGVCRIAFCDDHRADCNGDLADGCEVNLMSYPTDCGACGHACAVPANGYAGCHMGACAIADCQQYFADCDGGVDNGCETFLPQDPDHCGACGQPCEPGETCAWYACVPLVCPPGLADCDGQPGNGCETSLAIDQHHCGACGNVCASDVCAAAVCAPDGWVRQSGSQGNDEATGVVLDPDGNVYAAGWTGGDFEGMPRIGSIDAFLTSYDRTGSKRWTRVFGSAKAERAKGLAIDGAANLYVTGETLSALTGQPSAGGNDGYLGSYDGSGNQRWMRQFGTPNEDFFEAVATDGAGNVYATGATYGGLHGGVHVGFGDVAIVSYDPAGNHRWTRQFGSPLDESGHGVATDAAGNVYVTGSTQGVLTGPAHGIAGWEVFLVSYTSAGDRRWIRQFGGGGTVRGEAVATDGNGNSFVVGEAHGSLDGQPAGAFDAFIKLFDGAGNPVWTRQLDGGGEEAFFGVALDGHRGACAVGRTSAALAGHQSHGLGWSDAILACYDFAGHLGRTEQIGTPLLDFFHAVAVDASGRVHAAGSTQGTFAGQASAGESDAFLVRFPR